MRDMLCREMDWQRWDERKKKDDEGEKWRDVDPPADVAGVILARAGDWKFPAVVGITSTPTMRPDGSILVDAGYDRATGLILFEPPSIPPIPARPTKDDALGALGLLDDLIGEFPFVDAPSRSVALSGFITPSVRAAIAAAPLHGFTAPNAGTGKSYLVDIISSIYSGLPCPVIGKGESSGELEKRVNASLIAGHPYVNIDNVNGDLGGDFLCHAIERPRTNIRILGRSTHAEIQNTVTMFATGNNMRLVGDIIRRSLVCSMDAGIERPELRAFKQNPIAKVLSSRGQYIAACLTIVRAYLVAGSPSLQRPMHIGSFQRYSDLVRSPLIWLGCDDPVKTMDKARENDPELEALRDVLSAIGEEIGFGLGSACTAAKIIAAGYPTDLRRVREESSAIREALDGLKQKGRPMDALLLGQWLARHKDRTVSGLRLVKKPRGKRACEWYVERAGGV